MQNKVYPNDLPPPPSYGQPSGYGQPCGYPQPPPQYSQQPVQYGQQPAQYQYGQTHVHVTQQQPAFVQAQPAVVVQQPLPSRTDYNMPEAKVPGILMLISAVLNLICFVTLIIFGDTIIEFAIAFFLYLTVGILACVGAFQDQRTSSVATGCLVMACFALCMAFGQVISRGVGIGAGQILMAIGWHELGKVIYLTSIFLEVVALLCFALSIALIVLPSKVLCTCCGAPPRQAGAIIVHQRGLVQNTQVVTMS